MGASCSCKGGSDPLTERRRESGVWGGVDMKEENKQRFERTSGRAELIVDGKDGQMTLVSPPTTSVSNASRWEVSN